MSDSEGPPAQKSAPAKRERASEPRAGNARRADGTGPDRFLAAAQTAALRSSAGPAVSDAGGVFSTVAWIALGAVAALVLLTLRLWRRPFEGATLVGASAVANLPGPAPESGVGPPEAPPVPPPASAADAALVAAVVSQHERTRAEAGAVGQKWVAAESAALAVALRRFAPAAIEDDGSGQLGPTGLSDSAGQTLAKRLEQASDADLVFALLTLHKLAENEAGEGAKPALAAEATAISNMLKRFAPDALDDGLATYFGNKPPDFEG